MRGFELEVLESYEVALPQNFTAWMMVIGNEDRQDRLPAAVGVVCASDANDAETRVVSPQEQQQINNVVQQFRTTTTTSIDQVINIINNATTPGGTGTPTTPSGTGTPTITATADPATYEGPCPSSIEVTGTITDNVGNRDVTYRFILQNGAKSLEQETHFDQPGSESVSYLLPGMGSSYQGWVAIEILQPVQLQSNQAEFAVTCTPNTEGAPPAATDTTPPVIGGTNIIGQTPDPAGVQVNYIIKVEDDVDGEAYYGDLIEEAGMLPQDKVGGDIAVSCNPPHGSIFPIGITTVQCSATDAAGNTGTRSFTVTMELIPPRTALAEEQPSVEEAPAEGEPAAPPAEGEPAATEEGEAATTPPVDNTG